VLPCLASIVPPPVHTQRGSEGCVSLPVTTQDCGLITSAFSACARSRVLGLESTKRRCKAEALARPRWDAQAFSLVSALGCRRCVDESRLLAGRSCLTRAWPRALEQAPLCSLTHAAPQPYESTTCRKILCRSSQNLPRELRTSKPLRSKERLWRAACCQRARAAAGLHFAPVTSVAKAAVGTLGSCTRASVPSFDRAASSAHTTWQRRMCVLASYHSGLWSDHECVRCVRTFTRVRA